MRNATSGGRLCRAHALALEDDPIDQAFERFDDVIARGTDRLFTGAQSLLESFTQRLEAAGTQTPRPPRAPHPPKPPPVAAAELDPREVMGFAPTAKLTRAMVKERQRKLAELLHPDKGGSTAAMQRLNVATKTLLAQVK